jgi:hypothetical protein
MLGIVLLIIIGVLNFHRSPPTSAPTESHRNRRHNQALDSPRCRGPASPDRAALDNAQPIADSWTDHSSVGR